MKEKRYQGIFITWSKLYKKGSPPKSWLFQITNMKIWFLEDYMKAYVSQLSPSIFLRFPLEKLEQVSTDRKKKVNFLIKIQVVND